jgi:hypothetical protein
LDQTIIPLSIDGTAVLIEIRPETDPEQDVGALPNVSFDGVVDSIEAIARRLAGALTTVKPDKATLEFGVDIGLESGSLTALIVKGTGTATIKITLEWATGSPTAEQSV